MAKEKPIKRAAYKAGESEPEVILTSTKKVFDKYLKDEGLVKGKVPPPPPTYFDIPAAKKGLADWIDDCLSGVTGVVPQKEELSWPSKEAAARAVKAAKATASEMAMIKDEADEAEETIDQLADRIIFNADVYRKISSKTAAIRRKTFAKIDAATDMYEVDKQILKAQTRITKIRDNVLAKIG